MLSEGFDSLKAPLFPGSYLVLFNFPLFFRYELSFRNDILDSQCRQFSSAYIHASVAITQRLFIYFNLQVLIRWILVKSIVRSLDARRLSKACRMKTGKIPLGSDLGTFRDEKPLSSLLVENDC